MTMIHIQQAMERVLFIVNPVAGHGKGARAIPLIERMLSERGIEGRFWVTERPGEATGIARPLVQQGAQVIVVVGGDGTIQEVANAILGTDTALGIIPAGSGDDFVKVLGIPKEIPGALDIALGSSARTIDLGRITGRIGERYFVNAVGIGFDAMVGAEKEKVIFFRGFSAYLWGLVKTFFRYRSPVMRICFEDQQIERKILMATIGNGTCCGGGFYLTPDAVLDDGLLDLCVVRHLSRFRLLWHLPKVLKGTHTGLDEVTMARCRAITVESDVPLMIHADGEIWPEKPTRVDIEIVPKALKVVVPPSMV